MAGARIELTEEVLAGAVGDAWSREQIHAVVKMLAKRKGRFGRGRQGVPPELTAIAQRLRILLAMQRACAEFGYRDTTVHHVLERAGVSRPTFYEYFNNKEDCFLLAFDFAAERLQAHLTGDTGEDMGEGDRHARLQATLADLLRFVASEPDAARTLIIESRGANPTALQRHNDLLDDLAACIGEALEEASSGTVNGVTAEGVVAGIEAVLYGRLTYGKASEVEALLPALMSFAAPDAAGRAVAGTTQPAPSASPAAPA